MNEKDRMDYRARMHGAFDEGRSEGFRQGAEEKACETVRKLKAMGIPVEQITESAGLTLGEIREL
ncbi:MAG: hypothetical protein LBR47_02345 [Spirochaetaceae bacterium]|jgi:predicted transposase/invertase (TIGR01784 family)|nr:hypothetical protein [Spirochaetaceae bacterium]